MPLKTVVEVAGNAAIVAEVCRDIDTQTVVIRVYIGESLVLQLSPKMADDLADAVTDLEPVVYWPAGR